MESVVKIKGGHCHLSLDDDAEVVAITSIKKSKKENSIIIATSQSNFIYYSVDNDSIQYQFPSQLVALSSDDTTTTSSSIIIIHAIQAAMVKDGTTILLTLESTENNLYFCQYDDFLHKKTTSPSSQILSTLPYYPNNCQKVFLKTNETDEYSSTVIAATHATSLLIWKDGYRKLIDVVVGNSRSGSIITSLAVSSSYVAVVSDYTLLLVYSVEKTATESCINDDNDDIINVSQLCLYNPQVHSYFKNQNSDNIIKVESFDSNISHIISTNTSTLLIIKNDSMNFFNIDTGEKKNTIMSLEGSNNVIRNDDFIYTLKSNTLTDSLTLCQWTNSTSLVLVSETIFENQAYVASCTNNKSFMIITKPSVVESIADSFEMRKKSITSAMTCTNNYLVMYNAIPSTVDQIIHQMDESYNNNYDLLEFLYEKCKGTRNNSKSKISRLLAMASPTSPSSSSLIRKNSNEITMALLGESDLPSETLITLFDKNPKKFLSTFFENNNNVVSNEKLIMKMIQDKELLDLYYDKILYISIDVIKKCLDNTITWYIRLYVLEHWTRIDSIDIEELLLSELLKVSEEDLVEFYKNHLNLLYYHNKLSSTFRIILLSPSPLVTSNDDKVAIISLRNLLSLLDLVPDNNISIEESDSSISAKICKWTLLDKAAALGSLNNYLQEYINLANEIISNDDTKWWFDKSLFDIPEWIHLLYRDSANSGFASYVLTKVYYEHGDDNFEIPKCSEITVGLQLCKYMKKRDWKEIAALLLPIDKHYCILKSMLNSARISCEDLTESALPTLVVLNVMKSKLKNS